MHNEEQNIYLLKAALLVHDMASSFYPQKFTTRLQSLKFKLCLAQSE